MLVAVIAVIAGPPSSGKEEDLDSFPCHRTSDKGEVSRSLLYQDYKRDVETGLRVLPPLRLVGSHRNPRCRHMTVGALLAALH